MVVSNHSCRTFVLMHLMSHMGSADIFPSRVAVAPIDKI